MHNGFHDRASFGSVRLMQVVRLTFDVLHVCEERICCDVGGFHFPLFAGCNKHERKCKESSLSLVSISFSGTSTTIMRLV